MTSKSAVNHTNRVLSLLQHEMQETLESTALPDLGESVY